jgi:hypothetical protein
MYISFKEKPKLYTLLLNANSHNPIISFIYCFKSVIKRPQKKVGMLKLQLINTFSSIINIINISDLSNEKRNNIQDKTGQ